MAGFQFTPLGVRPLDFIVETHRFDLTTPGAVAPSVEPRAPRAEFSLRCKRFVAHGILRITEALILPLQRLRWWAQWVTGANHQAIRMRRWQDGRMERDSSQWRERHWRGRI